MNETHYKIPHTVHVEGRNTSGSLAVKTIGRRPDGTQISQVREKFHSKSSTAALGIITKLLLSVRTGSYLNPKPSKMPLIVCNAQFWFSFLFSLFISFLFALLLRPNCDGWRLSGAWGSWAVAKTHAHQRNIMKVCHLSCMAWSLLLHSWQCTCAVIRLCRADNNYNFTRKTEGSIALRWSNFASYCHALKYLILLHEYRLSCPVWCLYLSLHPFQISASCLVKMETLKNVLKD